MVFAYTVGMPKLLDLFCGPGGGARGYADAGFEILGVDIDPQPSYPFPFIRGDVFAVAAAIDLSEFDLIHASPPCQRYSSLTSSRLKEKGLNPEDVHPDLIPPTRELLRNAGVPYVIENVEGAPVRISVTLCGTMWQKKVRWHRLFETSFEVKAPATCDHGYPVYNPFARKNHAEMMRMFPDGPAPETVHAIERGVKPEWMTYKERRQALPPYYTEHIGKSFLAR